MSHAFADIERRLAKLLSTVRQLMSARAVPFVEEFIDVGEYGLALEEICYALIDSRAALPDLALEEVRWLEQSMEMGFELSQELGQIRDER